MRDAEFVDLKMHRGTQLVIFEYLARSHDEWSKTGKAPDDYSDSTFVLSRPDPGERVALGRLEGEIERTLPDAFDPEYKELIAAKKKACQKNSMSPGGRKVDLVGRGD
jgi:hypothetical protein